MEKDNFDFYRRAAIVCRRIPYGKTATYGQIALLCGKPGNARQVGYALNRGRLGDGIPAHRVVNSRGILSGAAYFETYDLQKLLLAEEGVQAVWTPKGWQVNLGRFGWKNTFEDAEELRAEFLKAPAEA